MKITLTHHNRTYRADLSQPLDLSMPLSADGASCFYAPPFEYVPVVAGSFIGEVAKGGAVNFMNVRINPHGNGTHTECVGHIAPELYSINEALTQFAFLAEVVTLYPTLQPNGDRVITHDALSAALQHHTPAVVLRTMPNTVEKLHRNYAGTNPPYLEAAAAAYLAAAGVEHLLLDLPSVDREEDGGALAAHKAFWQYPNAPRHHATITELIFVRDDIKDGLYLLHHQIAPFTIDASPSKPTLYALF